MSINLKNSSIILEGPVSRESALEYVFGILPELGRKVLDNLHPDVEVLEMPDNKIIPVTAVREIRSGAFIRPFEGNVKVYIILSAQNLNQSAQNAFLKLLEEPPPYAVFILAADSAFALLPTVRSRCAIVRLPKKDSGGDIGAGRSLLEAFETGNEEALLRALNSFGKKTVAEYRAILVSFVDLLRLNLKKSPERFSEAISTVLEIIEALDGNTGIALCSVALCVKLTGGLNE